ncbi:MAG: hypothetical protein DRN30_06600 [Thermoplasmata archaeon]|nr:MAG: hypothetical protein DRN30_06600 [Thermoplasmata archaeon]
MEPDEARKIFKELSRKYAIEILLLIKQGKKTPKQLKKNLGITEGSLYQVLNPLLDCGILDKDRDVRVPPRSDYKLTKRGEVVLRLVELLLLTD